jgi:hypothetical protein
LVLLLSCYISSESSWEDLSLLCFLFATFPVGADRVC